MGEGRYRWWVLVTAIFGVFVSILDTTIVTTAIPRLQAIFGADLHRISYVATGYTLAQGVVVAASGFLANRFGIKRIYLGSLALFTLGSALCGFAWNVESLIVFRVLQGAGGATLFPLSLSLIFATFPPQERGLANGLFGIPVLFAPVIGPTLGGYIVQFIDWRWIFYVNVPIGVLGVLIGSWVLRESPRRPSLRFDLPGFALIAPGLGLLLYGLSNLAYDGWGSITTVSGPIIAALLLLLTFIPVELTRRQPLLDLRLFTSRNFWAGNLIIWLGTVGLFGAAFLLPQYLQNLRGLAPFNSGLLLLPQGLAAIAGTILAGVLYNRVGPRVLMIAGAAALVASTFLISRWTTLTSAYSALLPLLILRGVALPPLVQTSNTVALQGIPPPALPGASTLVVVTRSVVASLAIAVLTNLLQTRTIVHNVDLASRVTLSNPTVAAAYHRLIVQFSGMGRSPGEATRLALGTLARMVALQARALAFQDIYWIAGAITIPAIVLPLLLHAAPRRAARPQAAAASGSSAPHTAIEPV